MSEGMRIEEALDMLKEFNRTYEVLYAGRLDTEVSIEKNGLRYDLMLEELEEYKEALKQKDLIGVADAVTDMFYILLGTILDHGLQDSICDLFKEVHRSNMSKLENGKVIRREDGKVLKGSSYSPPDLASILNIREEKGEEEDDR